MDLCSYLQGLLVSFNDKRTLRNIKNLVGSIIEFKTIRLWTLSKDVAAYERNKRLINGKLKSVLDDKKISSSLRERGVSSMGGKDCLVLLHDPCDIRKQYSKELECLGKVRSLDGKIINGYSTFNTVMVDERGKNIQPFDITVYSNRDEKYVTEKELRAFNQGKGDGFRDEKIRELLEEDDDVNLFRITIEQLERTSFKLKEKNPEIALIHVLDRYFDGNRYFHYINDHLEDQFVIRMKKSRNSPKGDKLKDVDFPHKQTFQIDKVKLKKKVYQQVKCVVEYDTLPLDDNDYWVVRITLLDRTGKMIFKHPMLLITNIPVETAEQARKIYHTYLMRSKIEGVFKFLKNVLGWEEFQVQDYESIKNIIALCYFIGGYFYEIESELVKNETVIFICQLGGGKGKVTRHFFLQGLAKLLVHHSVNTFVKEHNISQKTWEDMCSIVNLKLN